MTDEWIETAFGKIRADFEKRGNEVGLEILDGYEKHWQLLGRLSDRQCDWLERQLKGTWRTAKPSSKTEIAEPVMAPPSNETDFVVIMIAERLAAKGKALVDVRRIVEAPPSAIIEASFGRHLGISVNIKNQGAS